MHRIAPRGRRGAATFVAAAVFGCAVVLMSTAHGADSTEKPAKGQHAETSAKAATEHRTTPNSEQQLVERRRERLRQLPAPPNPPEVDGPTYNPIDQFIVERWKEAPGTAEPQLCDDPTFLRRAYLDIIGLIPTPAETNRFLASTADRAKREKLVDQLLRTATTTRPTGLRFGRMPWLARTWRRRGAS